MPCHLLNAYCPRGQGEKRLNDHIAELKRQLTARDEIIQRLQKDLSGKEKVECLALTSIQSVIRYTYFKTY